MGALDASIILLSFPALTKELHTTPTTIVWVTIAYLLVSTGLQLTFGTLGDLIGRKKVFVSGFAVFTVGLSLCAVAQNIPQLILFRVIQGVGWSMVISNGGAIVTAAFPGKERGKALGFVGGIVGFGLATGPVIGGLLVDTLGWRSVFYIRIPVGLVALALAWRVLKEQRALERRPGFDVRGAVLFFAGMSCLLVAVNQVSRVGATSPLVLLLAPAALVSFIGFWRSEYRAEHPVLDPKLFMNRIFLFGCVSLVLMFIAQSSMSFLMPFYLIDGLGRTARDAGYVLITVPICFLVMQPISGNLSDRIGVRPLAIAGSLCAATGFLLLSRVGPESSTLDIVLRLAVAGIGVASFQSPNNSSIMGAAPRERLGTASGAVGTGRQVGISVGLAISSAVFAARRAAYDASMADNLALVNAFRDAILVGAIFTAVSIVTTLAAGKR